ncbi:MAG: hypothetical protein ABSE63_01615 [Thermoguttaceae bacterium]
MQRIGWIVAVLLTLGWVASEFPVQNACSNDRPRVETAWRRTVDGWEDASQWSFYSFTSRPVLHPFCLSVMQCAIVAWIVFSCYLVKFISGADSNRLPRNNKKSLPPGNLT